MSEWGEDAEKCVEVREGCFKDHDKIILDLGVPENRQFRIMMARPGDGRGGGEAVEEGEGAQRQQEPLPC